MEVAALDGPESLRSGLSRIPRYLPCRQSGEQLPDGFRLTGEDQIWSDFLERLKHESPFVRPRVRQNQFAGHAGFFAEGDQVQIQGTWFVENFFRLTAEFFFQRLQFRKQCFRRFLRARSKSNNGVQKVRRAGRTIHRRSLPERGLPQGFFGKLLKLFYRLLNAPTGIAEIRAERNDGQSAFCLLPSAFCLHFNPSTSCMSYSPGFCFTTH